MPESLGSLTSLLFLGFLLGIRHATDADHVVAVATIVSRQRALRGSAVIGAFWGIGHTLTVLAVGGAIILFGVVVPPRLGLAMEFAVGLMLVALGVLTLTGTGRVIREAAPSRPGTEPGAPHRSRASGASGPHRHAHAHGDYVHSHRHGHVGGITAIPRTRPRSGGSTGASARPALYGWAATAAGRRRARACRLGGGGAAGAHPGDRAGLGPGLPAALRCRDRGRA